MTESKAAKIFASLGGRKGGQSQSPAKLAAVRANGSKLPKPGSRPRGRPRKDDKARSKADSGPMPVTAAEAREAAAILGKRGGKQSTEAKVKAGKRNIRKAIAARWAEPASS